MALAIKVQARGPLFRVGSKVFNEGIQGAVRELVDAGTERLNETLRPRPAGVYLSVAQARTGQASTGHYRRSIHPVVKHLHGVITDGGVVYGPWLEGVSSRNQRTRFKGYASFRKTAQWLRRHKAKDVLKKHIGRAVRRMGGR